MFDSCQDWVDLSSGVSQFLGRLLTDRALGHSGTRALGHSGTRAERGNRLADFRLFDSVGSGDRHGKKRVFGGDSLVERVNVVVSGFCGDSLVESECGNPGFLL